MKKFLLILVALLLIQTESIANVGLQWYDDVWKLINNEYIDPTFNNQNWDAWRNKYDSSIKTENDAYIAIETMLHSLNDQFTTFFLPTEYSDLNTSLAGKSEGFGFSIYKHRKGFKIESVEPNSPASNVGLKADDIMLALNGQSLKKVDIDTFAQMLDKSDDKDLSILVKRKGEKDKIYTLKIEKYDTNSIFLKPLATKEIIPEDILYTRIETFANKQIAHQFHDIFKKTENVKGIIIDLRENGGGYVDRAATLANMFLQNKVIVTTIDRFGKAETVNANEHILTEVPIVVLINENSASASEIFAGAMQDNKRAKIVGTTSYGKGIVQRIDSLSNGAGLNFTVKKYLTPNGNSIHKKGITPDYTVKMRASDYILHRDSQLRYAIELLEG